MAASLQDPASPPTAPSRIGPYRVESKLGTGGMGEVYRATDERSGRPVAVKRLSNPMAKRGRERERLRREAQAVARLQHPAIVKLVGFLENEGGHWLVMELVTGESLTRLLRERGPLGVATTLDLFHQVAGALAEAHEQGILHRDLKTDNVMVTAGGRAKLLDFGLALTIRPDHEESRLTIDGRILGTPHAMSPEQARGWGLDHRSDLFSLGSLLYESLTGVKPFLGADPMESLRRVCFTRQKSVRELRPEVPRELSWLVDRLLEKDPRQRPQNTRDVAEALGRLRCAGTAPETRPRARPEPAPSPVGKPEDLDLLHGRWRRAVDGRGQLVEVSGDAGAGKSRLVAALQQNLRSREMTWLACRCSPFEKDVDFGPFVDLLRRLLDTGPARSGDPRSRIEALETLLGPHAVTTGVVPLVAEMLADTSAAAPAGRGPAVSHLAGERKDRILATFVSWLEEIARERTALLVFEEVQWADPATLELLQLLIEKIEGLPMMLLLTSRPDFRPPWGRRTRAIRLTLGP